MVCLMFSKGQIRTYFSKKPLRVSYCSDFRAHAICLRKREREMHSFTWQLPPNVVSLE